LGSNSFSIPTYPEREGIKGDREREKERERERRGGRREILIFFCNRGRRQRGS
jgi:hypothetical protein